MRLAKSGTEKESVSSSMMMCHHGLHSSQGFLSCRVPTDRTLGNLVLPTSLGHELPAAVACAITLVTSKC